LRRRDRPVDSPTEGEAKRRRAPQPQARETERTKAGAGSPKGNTGLEANGCAPPMPSQEGLDREMGPVWRQPRTEEMARMCLGTYAAKVV
jgi:hypothetical protein